MPIVSSRPMDNGSGTKRYTGSILKFGFAMIPFGRTQQAAKKSSVAYRATLLPTAGCSELGLSAILRDPPRQRAIVPTMMLTARSQMLALKFMPHSCDARQCKNSAQRSMCFVSDQHFGQSATQNQPGSNFL